MILRMILNNWDISCGGMYMKRILVSTDIGSDIDDALTLLIILNHPGIDLAGIYTVNGDVDSRCYIAKRMVELAGIDVAVCRGTSNPLGALVKPYSWFENWLIDSVYIVDIHFKIYG